MAVCRSDRRSRTLRDFPTSQRVSAQFCWTQQLSIFVAEDETTELLENTPQSFQRSYREFQTLAGRFSLHAGESATLYVRYRGANWSGIQPILFDESNYQKSRQLKNIEFLLLLRSITSLILFGSKLACRGLACGRLGTQRNQCISSRCLSPPLVSQPAEFSS